MTAGQKWVSLETGGEVPAIVVEQGTRRYYGDVLYIGGPAKLMIVHRQGRTEGWLSTRAPVRLKQRERRPTTATDETARKRQTRARNVKTFHQAIQQQRQVRLVYRSAKGVQGYTVIPLDVKPGKTARTRKRRYVWVWSEAKKGPLAFRLDRLLKVETAQAGFDPVAVQQNWAGKTVKWNLPRSWAANRKVSRGKPDVDRSG